MASFSERTMKVAREGLGSSVSRPYALKGVGEHISNEYLPHTCRSKVGSHQNVRFGSHPGAQDINPPFL